MNNFQLRKSLFSGLQFNALKVKKTDEKGESKNLNRLRGGTYAPSRFFNKGVGIFFLTNFFFLSDLTLFVVRSARSKYNASTINTCLFFDTLI